MILACKSQMLFREFDSNAASGQIGDDLPKVIQVPGQPIHRVNDQDIPVA